MPGWLIAAILFAVFTAVAWFARTRIKPKRYAQDAPPGSAIAPPLRFTSPEVFARQCLVYGALGCAALAVIFTLASSYNPVSTKNEGVETSFGKPVGHLHNGPHLTWPWIKVHEMDAAIQTDSYYEQDKKCLNVRIANQQTGCVDISIRWRICTGKTTTTKSSPGCQQNAVDDLFRDYRTFEHVRDSLVTRDLIAAVNAAFAQYNPLDSIKLGTSASGANNPLLSVLAAQVTAQMQREIGGQIEVLNTIIPIVHFDDATQARINQLQQQVAQTRIAEQERLTNAAKARANDALSKSVNTSPNVLVSQCLTTLEEMVKNSQPVPAGFSCWPGGGVAAVIAGPTAGSTAGPAGK